MAVILAELETFHSRTVVPTRRVAVGKCRLPPDLPLRPGAVLVAGVVGRYLGGLDRGQPRRPAAADRPDRSGRADSPASPAPPAAGGSDRPDAQSPSPAAPARRPAGVRVQRPGWFGGAVRAGRQSMPRGSCPGRSATTSWDWSGAFSPGRVGATANCCGSWTATGRHLRRCPSLTPGRSTYSGLDSLDGLATAGRAEALPPSCRLGPSRHRWGSHRGGGSGISDLLKARRILLS